jgi:hypothetical protein
MRETQAETERLLAKAGFHLLERTDRFVVYFRWLEGLNRQEVHVSLDGRQMGAWSVWENTRVIPPDADSGRRGRLNGFLRGVIALSGLDDY